MSSLLTNPSKAFLISACVFDLQHFFWFLEFPYLCTLPICFCLVSTLFISVINILIIVVLNCCSENSNILATSVLMFALSLQSVFCFVAF